jgi:putative ABC transport system permease protein
MTRLLTWLFGRLPIGWLQLSHSKTRLMAAVSGVAFANILVFTQLGVLGSLGISTKAPYSLFAADIMVYSEDVNALTDGSNIARQYMYQSLAVDGVSEATTLFIGMLTWQRSGEKNTSLQVFGIDPDTLNFTEPDIQSGLAQLRLPNSALIDGNTRGVPAAFFEDISLDNPLFLEANDTTLSAIGALDIGGGFGADGTLVVSDQTFLGLFPQRSAGAPNYILVNVEEGVSPELVVERLRNALPADTVQVNTLEGAANADLKFQTTQKPTGIIFGFGVLIGVLVGIVIVYQVLSTDVASHLREYATFKAMGFGQRFFLGIVFEEAIVLAVFGYVPGFLISAALYKALNVAAGLPVSMDSTRAIIVFVGTLIACTISGAIATRRLAGADPADLF